MNYAEAAYFDGNHCHHCAAYEDNKKRVRIEGHIVKVATGFRSLDMERRTGSRALAA